MRKTELICGHGDNVEIKTRYGKTYSGKVESITDTGLTLTGKTKVFVLLSQVIAVEVLN